MQQDELRAIGKKFAQGLEKLGLLEACMKSFAAGLGIELHLHGIESVRGELQFTFAGMRYYVRVRVTDRDVDDVGTEYRVPVGWLDWGRVDDNDGREPPTQSNFYDERGILCELDKQEFYCNFKSCDDDRIRQTLTRKLGSLVGRTIALNNTL